MGPLKIGIENLGSNFLVLNPKVLNFIPTSCINDNVSFFWVISLKTVWQNFLYYLDLPISKYVAFTHFQQCGAARSTVSIFPFSSTNNRKNRCAPELVKSLVNTMTNPILLVITILFSKPALMPSLKIYSSKYVFIIEKRRLPKEILPLPVMQEYLIGFQHYIALLILILLSLYMLIETLKLLLFYE